MQPLHLLSKNSEKLVQAAGQNPLAALALMILLIFSLAALFFARSDEAVKITIFLFLGISVCAFGAAVIATFRPPKLPSEKDIIAQETTKAETLPPARSLKRATILFVVSVLSGGIGAAYWYMFAKPAYSHFDTFERLDREWVGINPIGADDIKRIESVYRFKTKGVLGRIVEVSRINGSGGPSPIGFTNVLGDNPGNNCDNKVVHHVQLTYDDAGKIIQESNFDFQFRLLDHMRYTSNPLVARYEFESGASCPRTSSGASFVRFQYSDSSPAKLEQVYFLNSSLEPVANSDGAYGYRISYDSQGRRQSFENLNVEYKRLDYQAVYQRSSLGWIEEVNYMDTANRLAENKEGVAIIQYTHDEIGNTISRCYFDSTRFPVINNKGLSCLKSEYDDRGNMIRESYYDPEGGPTYLDGYASFSAKYDSLGRRIQTEMFNVSGDPTTIKSGYSKRRVTFDDEGNVISERYYDIEDNLTHNIRGYAERRAVYDKSGYKTQESYFDVNGNPVSNTNGWAKVIYKHDAMKNVIQSSFFDEEGKLTTNSGFGASIVKWEYDAYSNEKSVSYFDFRGKPTFGNRGIHRIEYLYQERTGKKVEERNFGVDGQPIFDKDGVHKLINRYDSFGRLMQTEYFGTDAKPTSSKIGAQKISFTKNLLGKDIEERYLDLNGKLTLVKDGYAIKKMAYDTRGNLIQESYFSRDHEPVEVDGVQTIVSKFDRLNLLVEKRNYDKNGNLTVNSNGWAIQRGERNSKGRPIVWKYLDQNEDFVIRSDQKFSVIKNTWDDYGRRISYRLWLDDITPVNGQAAERTSLYDSHGNVIETVNYTANGDPYLNDGYNRERRQYNRLGKMVLKGFFLEDVCKSSSKYGMHAVKSAYNRQGYQILRTFHDCDLKPVNATWGAGLVEEDRNQRGLLTEKRYFNIDRKPINSTYGYHKATYSYDRFEREIQVSYFDIDGNPVMSDEGYSRKLTQYDFLGNVAIEKYFNADGDMIQRD